MFAISPEAQLLQGKGRSLGSKGVEPDEMGWSLLVLGGKKMAVVWSGLDEAKVPELVSGLNGKNS